MICLKIDIGKPAAVISTSDVSPITPKELLSTFEPLSDTQTFAFRYCSTENVRCTYSSPAGPFTTFTPLNPSNNPPPPSHSPPSPPPTTPKSVGKIEYLPSRNSQTLAFSDRTIKEECRTLFHTGPRQSPPLPLQRDTHHQLPVSELECPYSPSENITASHKKSKKRTHIIALRPPDPDTPSSLLISRIWIEEPPGLLFCKFNALLNYILADRAVCGIHSLSRNGLFNLDCCDWLIPSGLIRSTSFNSNQVSNPFDCSDSFWCGNCAMNPKVSLTLFTVLENDQDFEGLYPAKKSNLSSEDGVSGEDDISDLSEFNSQMKLFQMSYLESNWDASIDALFNGAANRDGGNAMDLWSFFFFSDLNFASLYCSGLWIQRRPIRALSSYSSCDDKHNYQVVPPRFVSCFCTRFGFFSTQICAIGNCPLMVPYLCSNFLVLIFYPILWWRFWTMHMDLPSTCGCVFCDSRNYVALDRWYRIFDGGDRRMDEHAHWMSFGWFKSTDLPGDCIRAFIRCSNKFFNHISLILSEQFVSPLMLLHGISRQHRLGACECVYILGKDMTLVAPVVYNFHKFIDGLKAFQLGSEKKSKVAAIKCLVDSILGYMNICWNGLNQSFDELESLIKCVSSSSAVGPDSTNNLGDGLKESMLTGAQNTHVPNPFELYKLTSMETSCQANGIVWLFKERNFDDKVIDIMSKKCKQLEVVDGDRTSETWEYLRSIGILERKLSVIRKCSKILILDLNEKLVSMIKCFSSLQTKPKEVASAITKFPYILLNILEDNPCPLIANFEALGALERQIGKMLLLNLGLSENGMIGLQESQLQRVAIKFPEVICRKVDKILKHDAMYLQSCGFNPRRLAAVVGGYSPVLIKSVSNSLSPRIKFLEQVMGLTDACVLAHSFTVLNLSISSPPLAFSELVGVSVTRCLLIGLVNAVVKDGAPKLGPLSISMKRAGLRMFLFKLCTPCKTLRDNHHLEDKVNLEGEADDTPYDWETDGMQQPREDSPTHIEDLERPSPMPPNVSPIPEQVP